MTTPTKPKQDNGELLAKWFSIPATPKRKRTPRIVRLLEEKGYSVEKCEGYREDGRLGTTWEVWHPDVQGVTAIYDRLCDIPEENGGIPLNQ